MGSLLVFVVCLAGLIGLCFAAMIIVLWLLCRAIMFATYTREG